MAKRNIITVKDVSIRTMTVNGIDYICITDIAKQKNEIDPAGVIANWMRNRNTIEYLGLWETLYNPNFNPLEFEGFIIKQVLSAKHDLLLEKQLILCNILIYNMVYLRKLAKETNWEQRI